MGARSTGTEISRPIFSFAERFGLIVCLGLLVPLTFSVIASSVGLLIGMPFGARWFVYSTHYADVSRLAILVTLIFQWLDDHLGLIAVLCLVPLWFLLRHRPRFLAALMMTAALVVGCGLLPQFSHVWTIVHVVPAHPEIMQILWTVELNNLTFAGIIALILIALADRIDRECRLREADRAIWRNSGPSENRLLGVVHRRGHHQRALIRILVGGGLHPWMALARALPVASLPAMAVCCISEHRNAISLQEGGLPAPALASFVSPAHSKVQLRLSASGEVTFNVPESNAASRKADLSSLRALEEPGGKVPRIEIDVAPDAKLQVIVDALSALQRAGFHDLVFADN